jgi:hypothetical protein
MEHVLARDVRDPNTGTKHDPICRCGVRAGRFPAGLKSLGGLADTSARLPQEHLFNA